MAIISPRIPLVLITIWTAFFGLWMITDPAGICASYGVGYSTFTTVEKLVTDSTWQGLGAWYLLAAAPLSLAQRNATPQTQSMLCICAAVGYVFSFIFIAVGWSSWAEIGVTDAGQWTNVIVFAIFFVLCVLGADKPQIKFADFKSSLYWGYYLWLPIVIIYTIMMIFVPGTLLDAYGFELSGAAKKITETAMATSYPSCFLFILCVYKAQFVSADPFLTYLSSRFISTLFFGCFLYNAAGVSTWTANNKVVDGVGTYDKYIAGLKFNMWLCFVLSMAFYIPMAFSDKDVISLAKKEKPEKETKEVDAEKAADKTEVVEPLLAPAAVAPLVPLATTSVPQFQSYTMPAASYASPTAYATYTQPTRSTFAPTTTAYATAAPVYATNAGGVV